LYAEGAKVAEDAEKSWAGEEEDRGGRRGKINTEGKKGKMKNREVGGKRRRRGALTPALSHQNGRGRKKERRV